jgi:hypothetical protein
MSSSSPKLHLVVYTTIFGDYDKLNPVNFHSECDFICFTDDTNLQAKGWKIKIINSNFFNSNTLSRRIKILPHLYLQDYSESLYVDGNIKLTSDPARLFAKYLSEKCYIAIPEHQYHKCVYIEGEALLRSRRFSLKDKKKLAKQLENYKKNEMPGNFGMTENNIIFRRHLYYKSKILCNLWWKHYYSGFHRDQISLPYIQWAKRINIAYVDEGPRVSSQFFQINLHLVDVTESAIINFIRVVSFRNGQSFFYKFCYFIIILMKILNLCFQFLLSLLIKKSK